jgi:hypothetical protein
MGASGRRTASTISVARHGTGLGRMPIGALVRRRGTVPPTHRRDAARALRCGTRGASRSSRRPTTTVARSRGRYGGDDPEVRPRRPGSRLRWPIVSPAVAVSARRSARRPR